MEYSNPAGQTNVTHQNTGCASSRPASSRPSPIHTMMTRREGHDPEEHTSRNICTTTGQMSYAQSMDQYNENFTDTDE